MKTLFTTFAALMLTNFTFAKTYTVSSGKWTDAQVWNNQYPGTTIKADDVVIITGQITMNTGIVVEGTLQVDKGATMVGMKDLVIAKTGSFVNNGNTVMKRIINEGSIQNNLTMEAMMDVDNKGKIDNNNNLVAGNNFENFGGSASGKGGAYFVNNTVINSPASKIGNDVKVFCGNQIENSKEVGQISTTMSLSATLKSNKVELSVANPNMVEVARFNIEKSTDGTHYALVESLNSNSGAMTYTDTKVNNSLTYYRIKAINANGEETILPVATVKAPVALTAYTFAN
ncbi:MAG: hypothetical protein JWO06_3906 [Bacteroidota bacterium]|nr:hypothetical protein [Bacteroidota bacterium]